MYRKSHNFPPTEAFVYKDDAVTRVGVELAVTTSDVSIRVALPA
jgi:hypothetical protein